MHQNMRPRNARHAFSPLTLWVDKTPSSRVVCREVVSRICLNKVLALPGTKTHLPPVESEVWVHRFYFISRVGVHVLLVVVLAASPIAVLAQPRVSRPVGIMRIALAPRTYKGVAQPFDPWDASLDAVLAGQLTGSSNAATADRIFKWNASASAYESAWKHSDGRWLAEDGKPSSLRLQPGDGLFLQSRAGVATQQVYLAGELLVDTEHSMLLPPAINLLGYPYATAMELRDTALLNQPVLSTAPDQAIETLIPGEAFWCLPPREVLWTEPCPYDTSLFPTDERPPRITDIRAAQSGVTLSIAASGNPKERLDIFSQEMSTNRFDPNHGWFLVAEDLSAPNKALLWTDTTMLSAATPGGRFYLVASFDAGQDQSRTELRGRLTSDTDHQPSAVTPQETSGNVPVNQDSTNRTFRPIQIVDGKVVYVSRLKGDDALSGRSPVVAVPHGPKKRISSGLSTANKGDIMVIQEGAYGEDLAIGGKDISVHIQGRVDLSGNSSAETNALAMPPLPLFDAATNQVDSVHKPKTR